MGTKENINTGSNKDPDGNLNKTTMIRLHCTLKTLHIHIECRNHVHVKWQHYVLYTLLWHSPYIGPFLLHMYCRHLHLILLLQKFWFENFSLSFRPFGLRINPHTFCEYRNFAFFLIGQLFLTFLVWQ